MSYCTDCGAPLQGLKFCGNCGLAVAAMPKALPRSAPVPIPESISVLRVFAWLNLIGGAIGGIAWLLLSFALPSGIYTQIGATLGFALILEGVFGCALLLVIAGIARDVFLIRLKITNTDQPGITSDTV